MKKNDLKELVGLSIAELAKKAKDFAKEIEVLVFDKNMKKLKDVKSVAKKKQDLARVLTIKKQKETLEQLEEKVKKEEKK